MSLEDDIKKAYYGLAKIYHPDRQYGSEEEKKIASEKFMMIKEAFELLKKRRKRAYNI